MSRRARRNHTPAFKAKVALAAVKGQLALLLDMRGLPAIGACPWILSKNETLDTLHSHFSQQRKVPAQRLAKRAGDIHAITFLFPIKKRQAADLDEVEQCRFAAPSQIRIVVDKRRHPVKIV